MQKLILMVLMSISAYAQMAQIQGTIKDRKTQESVVGATVIVENTTRGVTTDIDGKYKLSVPAGAYNLKVTLVGYKPQTKYNINATTGNTQQVNFELEEDAAALDEVNIVVNRSISVASLETPNSIQKLTVEEIKNNPGGNFDISRVIGVLPGVGSTAGSVGGFRNDLIIRGGGPNENVFYLDGIEIPVINHFATQGSSGGPTGILNVSFIEDATLSSSSFKANYDNTLSSVLQFKQREGNSEKVEGNLRLSSTEVAATVEGPINSKTTFLASARRSYLQLLFQALDLPIRPSYWDFQYKITHKISKKATLNFIGVGAIDDFYFGVPKNSDINKEYILRSNPLIKQWNYTVGTSYKYLIKNGYLTATLSRNMFDNSLIRHEDGNNALPLIFNSQSQEIENKFRFEVNQYKGTWEMSYGLMAQYVKYNNVFFNILQKQQLSAAGQVISPELRVDFNTDIAFAKYGFFGQLSKSLLDNTLQISTGVRSDMNSFTTDGMAPLKTLSPRASVSYLVAPKWRINASSGIYYKIPIYTALGFQQNQQFQNKSLSYIKSKHIVGGIEFIPRPQTRFTVEAFRKAYTNYPVSTLTGISLANAGGDFGAIGNEKVVSTGEGLTKGIEFFAQQKLSKNVFGVFSYTFFDSKFSGADQKLISSAWNTHHIISTQLGRKFKKGYEFGIKYLFQGGAPYTPFDMAASQRNYYITGRGILDYSKLNTDKLKAFNRVDVRFDKKWNFKRNSIDLFFDIQNALLFKNSSLPNYTFDRDAAGFKTTDGKSLMVDGSNAIPVILNSDDLQVTPSLGFVWEF